MKYKKVENFVKMMANISINMTLLIAENEECCRHKSFVSKSLFIFVIRRLQKFFYSSSFIYIYLFFSCWMKEEICVPKRKYEWNEGLEKFWTIEIFFHNLSFFSAWQSFLLRVISLLLWMLGKEYLKYWI